MVLEEMIHAPEALWKTNYAVGYCTIGDIKRQMANVLSTAFTE